MRKIILVPVLAAVLLASQGCSVKRGVGLVNDSLTYREDFGNFRAEISLGAVVHNYFSDYDYYPTPYSYYRQETGQVGTAVPAGAGVYYRLFANDIFTVSAGLKYYDYLAYNYNYTYSYYRPNTQEETYNYREDFRIDYFSSGKVSVIFPDVEVNLPFSRDMKLAVNMELVYMRWYNTGGYYASAYEQNLDTYTGYTNPVDTFSYNAPGKITGVSLGSGLFYLGSINMGVMYYF